MIDRLFLILRRAAPQRLKLVPSNPPKQGGALRPDERVAALRDALALATRPELDHLAVELAELAIPPASIHPADLSPRAILRRWHQPHREALARSALEALLESADRLPESVQALLPSIAPRDLPAALTRVAASAEPAHARSAIRALLRADCVEAVAALLAPLVSGDSTKSKPAGHALLTLALGAGRLTPSRQRLLDQTLARAAEEFESHRDRNVLQAALLRIPLGSPETPEQVALQRTLRAETWAGHAAVRSVLRHSPLPELRRSAWHWLRRPELAHAALDRLARAESSAEHEAVLADAHLALAPARARQLRLAADARRAAANLGDLVPGAAQAQVLSDQARLGRVRLVSTFRVGSVFTRALLELADRDPSPSVRLAAVRAQGPGVSPEWLRDAHPAVARVAANAWSTAGEPSSIAAPMRPAQIARFSTAAKLSTVLNRAVARLAREDAARLDPWDPATPSSRVAAARWFRDDSDGFLRALRIRLRRDDTAVATIATARHLGLATVLQAELLQLMRHDEPRIVATAVAALGTVASDEARGMLRLARTHVNPRVRANAVDASVHQARLPQAKIESSRAHSLRESLIELKDADAHRERAGALRALLETTSPEASARVFEPAAVASLHDMLNDERPAHRLSGVWACEKVLLGAPPARLGNRWHELADRLTERTTDSDPAVQARATRSAARLLARLNPIETPDEAFPDSQTHAFTPEAVA